MGYYALFVLQTAVAWAKAQPLFCEGLQLVIHGLPYAMAWQELKDLLRTITATGGGNELRQVRAMRRPIKSIQAVSGH